MKSETSTDGIPADIRARSFRYAVRAVKLYRFLQDRKDGAGWVIGKQYLRSATSIGANLQEATSAESRPDFIHKYGIAQKEARESLYWLQLMAEAGVVSRTRLGPLIRETEELISILTAILLKLKRRKPITATGN